MPQVTQRTARRVVKNMDFAKKPWILPDFHDLGELRSGLETTTPFISVVNSIEKKLNTIFESPYRTLKIREGLLFNIFTSGFLYFNPYNQQFL